MIFLNSFLKFIFLLTPFFALSMFLSMTQGHSTGEKRQLALQVGLAALGICLVLFFFGRWLFEALGITIDSFRIGGGALLFLSAVGLVNSNVIDKKNVVSKDDASSLRNIAVVPLAIPVIVGPGTTAALLEPAAQLRKAEDSGDYTSRLVLLEESRCMPFAGVWKEFCRRWDVPAGPEWLDEVKAYEKKVLSRRG